MSELKGKSGKGDDDSLHDIITIDSQKSSQSQQHSNSIDNGMPDSPSRKPPTECESHDQDWIPHDQNKSHDQGRKRSCDHGIMLQDHGSFDEHQSIGSNDRETLLDYDDQGQHSDRSTKKDSKTSFLLESGDDFPPTSATDDDITRGRGGDKMEDALLEYGDDKTPLDN